MPVGPEDQMNEAAIRSLGGPFRTIVNTLALAFVAFQAANTLGFITLTTITERAVHLCFAFTLCFLMYSARAGRGRAGFTALDVILAVVVLFGNVYIITREAALIRLGPGGANSFDIALGIVMVILALEMARRVIGLAMPILAILMIGYALFGPYFPAQWSHRAFSVDLISSLLYFSDKGLYGSLTGLSASIIATFLIFGAVLNNTGGGRSFVDLARLVAGRSHGGPAKVSSISSALFGTVSGSAVANVIVDGVFNIPLMKRSGYSKDFAAAVEATASSGGQLMPPVMGTVAFVMAEFIGRPYSDVALAAAIPAVLYYFGLTSSLHFDALRNGYARVPAELIRPWRKVLRGVFPLLIPVVVLIALMSATVSPEVSVMYATISAIAVYLLGVRSSADLRARLRDVLNGLIDGGKAVVMLAVLIVCAEIVIVLFDSTGLGVKVSDLITGLAGTSLVLALVFAMITVIVLGMGVPTTAAYVIAASVVAPSLAKLGVGVMPAHMFILYFAIISAITPPVCPAIYAACAISGGRWWWAGVLAVRLALAGFLVPFVLVYSPELVLIGDPLSIIYRSVVTAAGLLVLSAGVMGYFKRKSDWVERGVLVIAALLLIVPDVRGDIAGALLGGAVWLYQHFAAVGPLTRIGLVKAS
jgi:TRAP transporter 4TM/12TM fusion protein